MIDTLILQINLISLADFQYNFLTIIWQWFIFCPPCLSDAYSDEPHYCDNEFDSEIIWTSWTVAKFRMPLRTCKIILKQGSFVLCSSLLFFSFRLTPSFLHFHLFLVSVHWHTAWATGCTFYWVTDIILVTKRVTCIKPCLYFFKH